MVRRTTRVVGAHAERLAAEFLTSKGLQTVARNFRCRLGEIDLVMRDGAELVFVEVRYRGNRRIASASTTVDRHKQGKLIRSAALFLSWQPRWASRAMRFDVIAIHADGNGDPTINWIRDAFRPADASL